MHCVSAGSRRSFTFPVLLSSVLTEPVNAIEMLLGHLNRFLVRILEMFLVFCYLWFE